VVDENFARHVVSGALERFAVTLRCFREPLLAPVRRTGKRHVIDRMPFVAFATVTLSEK
jgi:hypothetical protein